MTEAATSSPVISGLKLCREHWRIRAWSLRRPRVSLSWFRILLRLSRIVSSASSSRSSAFFSRSTLRALASVCTFSRSWARCSRSSWSYSRCSRSPARLASRYFKALITLSPVSVAPVVVVTLMVPASKTVPWEQRTSDRCLNNSTSCLNVSTRRVHCAELDSTIDGIMFRPSTQVVLTLGEVKSSTIIWDGSQPPSLTFHKLLRLKPSSKFAAATHLYYAKHSSSHILNMSFLPSGLVVTVRQLSSLLNSSFTGSNTPTFRLVEALWILCWQSTNNNFVII